MTNKQRNIISVFTKDDWNKKFPNTNFSYQEIFTDFFIVIFVAIHQVIKLYPTVVRSTYLIIH